MPDTKQCNACNRDLPHSAFLTYRRSDHYKEMRLYSICNECKAAKDRAYHMQTKGRRVKKRENEKPRDPRKKRARLAVTNAIAAGRLVVRTTCESCGSSPTQAHHDDYDKLLDVRWLCRDCHAAVHRKYGALIL